MSLDLSGIQNVGEFYSHHYLDALLENDLKGLFAQWRDEDESTPDKRLNRLATEFFAAKSQALRAHSDRERYAASHAFHVDLLEALGYQYDFDPRYLLDGSVLPVLGSAIRDGVEYLWLVETPLTEEDVSPLEQTLLRKQYPPAADELEELAIPDDLWETLVGEIFRRDQPPRWVILLAGELVFLADRTKWGYGQYLLFDLDEIFGARQRDTLRAVAALLAKDALCPNDGIPLHDTLDENSHKHAYGVSQDLKYGVRRAVELLAKEYVYYQRTVAKKALFQDDDLARKLTDEALTYLYRLLFLFYAEARGGELNMVPMKSEAYRTGYSLEMLRDLEQIPLNTPQAQNSYYLDQSLEKQIHSRLTVLCQLSPLPLFCG